MDDHTAASNGPRIPPKRTWFGLQLRFTILVLGVVLGVAGLVGGSLVDLAGQLAGRQKREQCSQVAALLGKGSSDPIQRGELDALQALADEFAQSASVRFVAITDPRGTVLASADRLDSPAERAELLHHWDRHDGILGDPALVTRVPGEDAHLEVAYPVIASAPTSSGDRPLLGYVRVALGVRRTVSDLAAAADYSSGVSLAMLLVAVPLTFFLVRGAVVRLNELSRCVRRFARGDLSARSTTRRHDEIGELAGAFDSMADELARKHNEIVALNADLEERVQQRTRQLRDLASRDALTGLYNRRHFGEVLESRFCEVSRYAGDLSCMMIDLDDFKGVNDRFGHHVGDELLILASITIASQLRAADVGARFGGDEFIILLPQTDAERAQVLATRLSDKFALDVAEQLPQARVSLSIGIASFADAAPKSPDDLIRAADQALYRAKATGKSRIAMAGTHAA